MSDLTRDRKKMYANPITCRKCGKGGGTLVAIKEGTETCYEHQDKAKCRILQLGKR